MDGHCRHSLLSYVTYEIWPLTYVKHIRPLDATDIATQADMHAYQNNQQSECMEEAARIMAKAFTNCMTDR